MAMLCPVHLSAARDSDLVGFAAALREQVLKGEPVATVGIAQGLSGLVPVLHQLSADRLASVSHLAAGPTTIGPKSVFGEHSSLMDVRNTGICMLSSHTVQECHDLALVAQLCSTMASLPVAHFFDGLRTSHETNQINLLPVARIGALMSKLSEHNGPVRLPIDQVPSQVDQLMEELAPVLGHRYHLFEYVGAPDASMVLVAMGSAAAVAEEAVEQLVHTGGSVGVVKVHLYRPWSLEHFVAALPQTVIKIAVLERTPADKEGYLFQDVAASLPHNHGCSVIVGARYGLSTDSLSVSQIKAAFDNLARTESSTPFAPNLLCSKCTQEPYLPDGEVQQLLSWGLSGDGTREFTEDILKLCCRLTGAECSLQAYSLFDASELGLCSAVHTRIDTKGRRSFPPSLVEAADIIVCSSDTLLLHYAVLDQAREGAVFLLNTNKDLAGLEHFLPATMKKMIADKRLQFYTVDADRVAAQLGLFSRTDIVMQSAFYSVAHSMHLFSGVSGGKLDLSQHSHIPELQNVSSSIDVEIDCLSVPDSWSQIQPTTTLSLATELYSLAHLMIPVKNLATPYLSQLKEQFGDRLHLINDNGHLFVDNAEYAFGIALSMRKAKTKLILAVQQYLESPDDSVLAVLLQQWLDDSPTAAQALRQYADEKGTDSWPAALQSAPPTLLESKSLWVVGGDGGGYEMGYRGILPALESDVNMNMLLLETSPISHLGSVHASKQQVGFYAITNCRSAFVACVAFGAGEDEHLEMALAQAEAFDGPSLVLAYCPDDLTNPAEAVDSGLWPLYRFDPTVGDEGKLWVDSEYSQGLFEEYLHPYNPTSVVVNKQGATLQQLLASPTENALEDKVASAIHSRNKNASMGRKELTTSITALLESMTGVKLELDGNAGAQVPLLVLYGSDGGNAQSVAKKFELDAKRHKMKVQCQAAGDFDPALLDHAPHLVFVVSTAGQGEFPMNALPFWEALAKRTQPLNELNFAVFALGDRHYWSKPGEEHFFCRPGHDLFKKLKELGAKELLPLGLGDDQDPDGYNTALSKFQPSFWSALGTVADLNPAGPSTAQEEAPKRTVEQVKEASRQLRGTLAQGLLDESTGAVAHDDTVITKFHGIYQQDDRDFRVERAQQKLEKLYSFMIRVGPPGGIVQPHQYLSLDQIADDYANGTLRITVRQAVQYHGIYKRVLKSAMQGINKACLTTLAACGDVNRVVMCNPNPDQSSAHAEAALLATELTDALLPRTQAYHEIWMDKKPIVGFKDSEPLYGPTYLPRKFKIAIAVPPSNDVDVFAHCLGYIAIIEDGEITGWNVTVGGGMGMTHNTKATFPRVADILGFVCNRSQAVELAKAVVSTQRDHGERKDRKQARLKYTVERNGLEWFREQVQLQLDFPILPARKFNFTHNTDRYGWTKALGDKWHFCLFVENGRIKDADGIHMKTGLKAIAEIHTGEFRFTPNQNIIIANVDHTDRTKIDQMLKAHNMLYSQHSSARLSSMACVALPTCDQAFAEAERFLPALMEKIEKVLWHVGLADCDIVIRMTGCPNGCARPYLAEIGFVGTAPGFYNLYLGAAHNGERLAKLHSKAIDEDEIMQILTPMFESYALQRQPGEHFGDFVVRAGYIKAQVSTPGLADRPPAITFHEHTTTW